MSVSELELPQTFRLKVQRVRFLVEVMLRTRLKDPVPVDFVIKRNGNQEQMCRGRSSELCIVRCNLLLHAFTVKLEGSPNVTTEFSLAVTFKVDFEPRERRVEGDRRELRPFPCWRCRHAILQRWMSSVCPLHMRGTVNAVTDTDTVAMSLTRDVSPCLSLFCFFSVQCSSLASCAHVTLHTIFHMRIVTSMFIHIQFPHLHPHLHRRRHVHRHLK